MRQRLSDVLREKAQDLIFIVGQMYFRIVQKYAVRGIVDRQSSVGKGTRLRFRARRAVAQAARMRAISSAVEKGFCT